MNTSVDNTARIRELNDRFRRSLSGFDRTLVLDDRTKLTAKKITEFGLPG
jgi:hypothetical protein